MLHAAQHYGVDATGITLSRPQAELANERIAEAGLAERCAVLVQDYREVEDAGGYDALVSVGMFEHVGEALLPAYFRARVEAAQAAAGSFSTTASPAAPPIKPLREPELQQRLRFPDGELVPINVTLRAAEGAGFEVRDVESLREHYALTLRHWVRRLEAHHDRRCSTWTSRPTASGGSLCPARRTDSARAAECVPERCWSSRTLRLQRPAADQGGYLSLKTKRGMRSHPSLFCYGSGLWEKNLNLRSL